jgi:glucose uptake protein GlcU
MIEMLFIFFAGLLGALGKYSAIKQFSPLKSFLLEWGSSILFLLILSLIAIYNNPNYLQYKSHIIGIIAIILGPIVIGISFAVSSNPLDQ